MKATRLLTCLSIFVLLSAARLPGQDLEHDLNAEYKGKSMTLLYPFASESVEFDPSGKPTRSVVRGAWPLYGHIQLTKISLKPDRLEIEGSRLGLGYVDGHLRLIELLRTASISIHLENPISRIEQAHNALQSVFALTPEAQSQAVPPQWREYLSAGPDQSSKKSREPEQMPIGAEHIGDKGVKAPRAISTPEPYLSATVRTGQGGIARFQIIVSPTGNVEYIRLVRSVGQGQDAECFKALRNWRFEPGTKNGEPTAVIMEVEMSFNRG
jgi:TonB family protein